MDGEDRAPEAGQFPEEILEMTSNSNGRPMDPLGQQPQQQAQQERNSNSNPLGQQPINCPWVSSQPYPGISRTNEPEFGVQMTLPMNEPTQMSSTQSPLVREGNLHFFQFLRLTQIFPETHPASIHSLLAVCRHDFFLAVDKMLFIKRCKMLQNRAKKVNNRRERSFHPFMHPDNQRHNSNNNPGPSRQESEQGAARPLDTSTQIGDGEISERDLNLSDWGERMIEPEGIVETVRIEDLGEDKSQIDVTRPDTPKNL